MVIPKRIFATLLLQSATLAAAHRHDLHSETGMDMGSTSNLSTAGSVDANDPWLLPSYSGLEAHSGLLLAHIAFMVVAWIFLLPIGKCWPQMCMIVG